MRRVKSRPKSDSRWSRLFRFCLGLGYVTTILLFALGYAARYVSPRYLWWIQLIAIGLPFVSALAVAATFVVLAKRQWVLVGLQIVIVVLVVLRFSIPSFGTPPTGSGLRVMTFNAPRIGQDPTQELIQLARETQPDIISFQEMEFYFNTPNARRSGRPDVRALVDSTVFTAYRPASQTIVTDQPILAKFEFDKLTLDAYDYVLRPRDRHPMEVVRAEATWQGKRLAVYNLHLASYGSRKPWHEPDRRRIDPRTWIEYLRRYKQSIRRRAWEVEKVVAILAAEELPTVITGDFNSTAHNWTYHQISEGLVDAFRTAGYGWGMTYHQKARIARIDFVLVDPSMEVLSAYVPFAGLSDHRPVVATIRWRD